VTRHRDRQRVRLDLGGWAPLPIWRKTLAGILGLVWLVLTVGLVIYHFQESSLRTRGEPATAEVLDIDQRGRNPDHADIRFVLPDGREVLTVVSDLQTADPYPKVGEQLDIRYDPASPRDDVVVAHVNRGLYWLDRVVWTLVLSALFGALALGVAGVVH